MLDVTGRSPDMFLFRRADRLDILALVAGLTLLPALAIWLVEELAGLVSGTARRLLHLVAVTGLLVVLAVEVAKATTGLRGPGLAAAAAAAGLGGGVLYASRSWPRLWLRFLTPAPVVFALLFLLASPTSALVLPARAATAPAPPVAVATREPPPVVMILFDEFPLRSLVDAKGRIDKRVYPNFAELARQSTWYRNATGVAGFTPWALPAMLTGNYPDEARAPSYTEYPDNLFSLFGGSYDVRAYETISQLCPPRQCASSIGDGHQTGLRGIVGDSARVLRQLLQPYDAAFDPALFVDQPRSRHDPAAASEDAAAAQFRFKQAGRNQPGRFDDFLAGLRAGDRPTLHFLHLLLPHQPWRYLPSGAEYNFETFGGAFRSDRLPAPLVELAHQQHLLQVAYTDRLVGQVMAKLKAEGLWERSLVVMGADHGIGWTPREPSRALGRRNAPDLMWVPQFIKAPGQDHGVVDDRNWEQVDLLPTVADLAGIPVPWKTDGVSQAGPPARTRTDKWWYDVLGRRQVRDGPANWAQVLRGTTDTLVRGSQGLRGLYRFGVAADLVGRDPASVGPIGGAPATAVLDDERSLERVDPGSGKVPALVFGRLASPPPPGATVLVAVNGTIGGGSRLFPERPGEPAVRFAAITPDDLWRPGPGGPQLQLYVATTGTQPHLQPVTVAVGGRR
ncbi:MAG TPA: sulfatase-like hydrolase/transferase [Actinomycetota bacterium]|nr:sulfatase-like hydrolase/transferase [Actinomycetota bacterium]